VFTARYGLIAYIEQITFSLLKVKREFSGQIFGEKKSSVKFHENRLVGVELFHAGGLNGQTRQ
jgi:hypothetical protein